MSVSRERVARSLLWTGLESVGLSGLSMIALVVFAHFLSPAEFGAASIALGIIQILNIPVEMLFHDALVQRKELSERHLDTAFTTSVCIGIGLCALCWIFGGCLARLVHDPQVASIFGWMSFSLPAMGFGSVLIARQRRELQFRLLALRTLIGRFSAAVIGIVIAATGGGVWSLVLQQVLMVALATAVLWVGAKNRPRFRFYLPELKALLAFGTFSTSVQLLYFSVQRAFMLVVGNLLGVESAGYLNIAFRSVDMLRDLLGGAVTQLSLPLFSLIRQDHKVLQAKFADAVQFTCALAYPVFGLLAVCSPDVVEVAYGARWTAAAPLVALMACLTLQFFPRTFSAPMMSACGKPQYPIPAQLIQFGFVMTAVFLLPHPSLQAVAAIWAARLLLGTPVDVWMLRRATGMSAAAQFKGVLNLLLVTAAMMAMLYFARILWGGWPVRLRLAAMVLLAPPVYLTLLAASNKPLCRRLLQFGMSAVRGPAAVGQNMPKP